MIQEQDTSLWVKAVVVFSPRIPSNLETIDKLMQALERMAFSRKEVCVTLTTF